MNNILKKNTNLFFTTTVYYFATLPENIDTFLRKQTVASIEQSIKQCSNATLFSQNSDKALQTLQTLHILE